MERWKESTRRAVLCALTGLCVTALPLRNSQAANALGQSGVVRIQDEVGFFIVDPSSGLMSFHGLNLSFAQLCSGAPFTIDPLTIQLIFTPVGMIHALFSGQENNVLIYPAVSLPDPNHAEPSDCPLLAPLPVLASGTTRVIRTDNSLTGAGPGANAFGWTATGTLKDTRTGADVQYSETVRALVVPGAAPGEFEIRELKVSIRLSP